MKHFKRTGVAALMAGAGLLAFGVAHAADGPQFKFSGFGTLAGTMTDHNDVKFRSSMNQSVGAGSSFDLGVDSRFGLQGTVDFGQGLTLVGQVLGQRRRVDDSVNSNRDFDLGVEWLMAQYSVNSNLDLRLGRVVLPAFMISDSRNVTYSQPWLRAPLEVYGQMPLTTLDGVQALWRIPVGAAVISVQPSVGKAMPNVGTAGVIVKPDEDRVAALNVTFEYGDWLARIGQTRGRNVNVNLDLGSAFGIPGLPALQYDMKDTFTNAGLQFDNGSALVMAEYATRRQNNVPDSYPYFGGHPLAKTDHWYVAGGWHVGKWLPMVAYGKSTDLTVSPHTSTTGIDLSVRYDLMPNVALKAQVSQYDSDDGAAMVSPTMAPTPVHKVNVLSVGLDFVF